MRKDLLKIPTAKMSRKEWLEQRRKSIGGSDAAAVIGLSQWASPYTVYLDKKGELPEKEETEAIRLGNDLEGYVAQRWCEATGKKVRRLQAMLYNPDFPFAHADVDRMVIGEDAGLECKTTSTLDIKQFRGVDFPEKYYAQCVHYMAVTGCKRWHLAVLVFGRGFYTFTLERDEDEIKALMEAERAFWFKNVLAENPPSPTGIDADTGAIETIYSASFAEKETDLFGYEALLNEYEQLQGEAKVIEKRIDEIKNIIKVNMADSEKGYCGEFKISWKPQVRRTFQVEELIKAYPQLPVNSFYKETVTRPLTIKHIIGGQNNE